jgi:hypothetical protein
MQYSRYFNDNEKQAKANGQRDVISYDEVSAFIGDIDDTTELLMDILNGVYSVDDCLKDIKAYK